MSNTTSNNTDISTIEYWSYSKLSKYLRCPRSFYYSYIKNISGAYRLKTHLGSKCHKVFQKNYEYKKESKEDKRLDELLETFYVEYNSPELSELPNNEKFMVNSFEGKGLGVITKFREDVSPAVTPIAIEQESDLTMEIDGRKPIIVKGVIDLIANTNLVVDHKITYRTPPISQYALSPQPAIYSMLYHAMYGNYPSGVLFDVFIPLKNETKALPYELNVGDEERSVMLEQLFHAIRGIQNEVFPPVCNNIICSWCGYSSTCLSPSQRFHLFGEE